VNLRRSIFIKLVLAVAILAVFVPLNSVRAASTETVDVAIDNFSFNPPTLKVKVGTQITWTNRDDIPHTVVSEDQILKSKVLDTDEKFTFTPTKPGTYEYFCSIHPKMTGKIVVE
jgi:plastocyanin